MKDTIISSTGISKHFGKLKALDKVELNLKAGAILGLIGPNGAGKTTLLYALLGLTNFKGDLEVLGKDPRRERATLLEEVCSIPDTAVLPRWMTIKQLFDYVAGIHPRFNRNRAYELLARTEITPQRLIKQLSKGMIVQLHLALVMSIDARLLILDEPTLGLDILFRKQFFEQLLTDFYDEQRTIIISTHQVDEVEHILTDIMFIKSGQKVLESSMQGIGERYLELRTSGNASEKASQLPWLGQRSLLGGKAFIFDGIARQQLEGLGDLHTPSLADLFVAVMGREK
ncbi:MAG: ABC transporter ATP-binding protein [Gammaproteobacteria bacterium]|nr:ABC transporter ATP-binding protein [Gammaproteobacteria bacterium]